MPLSATFTVGVTGHRPNRLRLTYAALRHNCADVLAALSAGAGSRRRIAISALAEGADRAFAEAALTCEYELQALLPFASPDYETTFADRNSTPTYHHLLARAARVDELPGRLDDSRRGYADLGTEIVARSDLIVAVWDGEPAVGKGGTPEVIEMALATARPVIWLDASGQEPPRRLPHAPPEPGVSLLDAALANSRPMKAFTLTELARRLLAPTTTR